MSRSQQIKQLFERTGKPLSTNQVANELGVDWHTAKKDLDELHGEGYLYRSEVSETQTLWWDRDIPL